MYYSDKHLEQMSLSQLKGELKSCLDSAKRLYDEIEERQLKD